MSLSTSSLRIFSALEVLRGGNADIRYALAALFQADLSKYDGELFDARKLAEEINSQYRLNLNRDVVEELLPIFSDLGWLTKITPGNGAFIVTCPADLQVATNNSEFEDKAKAIAASFREFIAELSPLSQVNLLDVELIDNLVNWLVSLDVLSETDLNVVAQVQRIGKKLVYNVTTPDEVRADDMAYLCARYAQWVIKEKSEHAAFLIELAGVGLITEVVRDFYKPTTAINKTDLAVYLDAPVALDLLGLSGRDTQKNIKDITEKVASLGGSIRIYRLSVEEMQTSLHALLSRQLQEREGPTSDALRRGEVIEAFVRQVAAQPDTILKSAGVTIVDLSVDQFPGEHRFFTKDAVDDLYSQIGWVKDDTPRFHDAAVSALIMRRRQGSRSADVFETRHILVTRNPFFPGVSRRVSVKHNYINSHQVGPVIHQRQLATAVWLRAGFAKSDETIPRRYILSACRRVLSLKKNMVQKVRQAGESLTPEQMEQLELLLTQSRSVQVLMDKTLGAESVIDSTNIALLVDEMRKGLTADVRAEAETAIRQVQQSAKKDVSRLQQKLIESSRDIGDLGSKLGVISDAHEELLASASASVVVRANKSIRRRRKAMLVLGSAIVGISEIAGFYGSGLHGTGHYVALAMVVTVSVVLLIREALVLRYLQPFFKQADENLLWEEAIEVGINPDTLVSKVDYAAGQFVIRANKGNLQVTSEAVP